MSIDVRAMPYPKFLALFILINIPAFADDVIVVTADRIKSNLDKSSSDVRIISADEIKMSASRSLPEILARESDLSVVNSGPSGSSASLFLRGTDSSHTLVVLDGIVMNDPSNPNRQFDIGKLSLNNIERIEILKGSQGLAYGSNAIGGVIVITSKKAKSEKASGESYFDVGSYKTVNAATNVQKKFDFSNLSFGIDYMNTQGYSVANEKKNPFAEKDGARRISLNLGANTNISESYLLDLNLRYAHNQADLDKGGGAGNDDPNDTQKEEELYSKIQLTKNWEAGNAQTKFSFNHAKHYRLLEVLYDAQHPVSSRAVSRGEINSLNANHTYYLNDYLTQNLNLEFSHEKDQSSHFNQNLSGFLYHQYEQPTNIFNFGIRLDHNRVFNDHITYKVAAGQKFQDSLLKLSFSTGFRAPSLNQLYDPTYGNKNLTPETSKSLDLSLEQNWSKKFKSSTTLFYTKIYNRFSYDPVTFINLNRGEAEIMGVEEKMDLKWSKQLNQTLAATFLKARDLSLGQKLARRPDINLKNIFDFYLSDKHLASCEVTYIGKRADVDNLGNPVQMNSYLISDVGYRYLLNEKSEYFLKIKNLFNTEYEEIFGYGTGGLALTAGAQFSY